MYNLSAGLATVESRKNPFELVFALDGENTARGELFFDDGESLDTLTAGTYFLGRLNHIWVTKMTNCSEN